MKKVVFTIIFVIFLLFIYWYIQAGERQDIQQMADQLELNINNVPAHEEEDALTPDPEKNQYPHTENAQFAYPDEVVKYVFATLLKNDINLFFGNWDANVLLDSIVDIKKMDEEMKEFMVLLSSNGTLRDIGIVDKKKLKSTPQLVTIQYHIKLLYDSFHQKDLFIDLSQTRDSHGNSQWLITSFLQDLRKQLVEQE